MDIPAPAPPEKPRPDVSSLIIPGKEAWGRRQENAEGRRMGPALWGGIAAALVLVLGAAWLFRDSLFTPSVKAYTVRVPDAREMNTLLTANGYVVARRESALSPKASGVVSYVGVDEGSRVEQGQVLVRLDDRDLRAQLQEMQATVAQDEREAARLRSLSEGGFAPGADLERAVSRLEVDTARLRLVEAQLENLVIRAPFAGIVTRKNVEVGESVASVAVTGGAAQGALRIVDMESLEVEADVSEANLRALAEGMPCTVGVDSMPGQRLRGRLRQIVPTADRQKGTVLVKVSLAAQTPEERAMRDRLLPEMTAQVFFERPETETAAVPRAPALKIPAAALAERQGSRAVVFLLRDGTARRREVEVISVSGDWAELRGGLDDGDVLAAEETGGLRDGQKVKIRKPS